MQVRALRISMKGAVHAVRELPPEDQARLMTYMAARSEAALCEILDEVLNLLARHEGHPPEDWRRAS